MKYCTLDNLHSVFCVFSTYSTVLLLIDIPLYIHVFYNRVRCTNVNIVISIRIRDTT